MIRRLPHLRRALPIALVSLLAACSGGNGSGDPVGGGVDGAVDQPIEPTVLESTTALAVGSRFCPAGGELVVGGADSDGDGVLSDDEIEERSYRCEDTPVEELGAVRHVVKFKGEAIVHHAVHDRESGNVLFEAFPFGLGHVGSAEHVQEFTTSQLRSFHALMTGAGDGNEAQSVDAAGRQLFQQESSLSATATTAEQLYHAGSVSNCGSNTDLPDEYLCGLAIGEDEDSSIGNLASSAGCYWFTLNAVNSSQVLHTDASALSSGKTVSDSLNVSGKVSVSYGAFSGSEKFSYSNAYASSEYGGSQSFLAYYLVTPGIALSSERPAEVSGAAFDDQYGDWPYISNWGEDETTTRDLTCGTKYQQTPMIGMLISSALTYQLDSESSSESFSSTTKVSAEEGLSSASAKVSTAVASASATTDTAFTFTVSVYGGGSAASKFIADTTTDTIKQEYDDCFSAQPVADPSDSAAVAAAEKAVSEACTAYFSSIQTASENALVDLQGQWLGRQSSRDISYMAVFPDGVDDPDAPTVTSPLRPVPSGGPSSRASGIGSAMLQRLPLLNELTTLSLRVASLATSTKAPATAGVLNLSAELSALDAIYAADRDQVLAALESCLLGIGGDASANDCTGMDLLADAGVDSAYAYYADALSASALADSVRGQLNRWYYQDYLGYGADSPDETRALGHSSDMLFARENAVALPLSGSLTACTRESSSDPGRYSCRSDFATAQNVTMAAVWLPTLPSTSTTPSAIRGKPALVVFPFKDYYDVWGKAASSNSGQEYWVLLDKSNNTGSGSGIEGIARLFEGLTGSADSGASANATLYRMRGNQWDSDYSNYAPLVNNDNAYACTDFSMTDTAESPAYCQLSLLSDWSEDDEAARWVTPRSIDSYGFVDNGDNERQLVPPDCTWARAKTKDCDTQFALTGFGTSTRDNNVHYLEGRYTNLNRIGFGARDEYGEMIDFTSDTVGDRYDVYTDPAGGLGGEKKVEVDGDADEVVVGFGASSSDSAVKVAGVYYKTLSYEDAHYEPDSNRLSLAGVTRKVKQDPDVAGDLVTEVNVPGPDDGVIQALALRVKNKNEKAASYLWGHVVLDTDWLPKATLVLRRDASFYQGG
jgi:hypothetical protein